MQDLLGEQDLWACPRRRTCRQTAQISSTKTPPASNSSTHSRHGQKPFRHPREPRLRRRGCEPVVPLRPRQSMDTHSSWPDLIGFLYALQKPDQFIVCEAANIQVDPSDQTKMLGHLQDRPLVLPMIESRTPDMPRLISMSAISHAPAPWAHRRGLPSSAPLLAVPSPRPCPTPFPEARYQQMSANPRSPSPRHRRRHRRAHARVSCSVIRGWRRATRREPIMSPSNRAIPTNR